METYLYAHISFFFGRLTQVGLLEREREISEDAWKVLVGGKKRGGKRERACPLKKAAAKALGMSMASLTLRWGQDQSTVENGYGGSG